MKARKKLFLWTVAGFGILIVIIVLGLIFLSQLINLESTKKKIMTKVSEKTGAQVNYADVDFSLFPLPHLTIRKGSFFVNKKANGSFEKISVYPKILPLFKGKVKLYRVSIASPHITSNLPERAELKESTKKQFSINELWKVITSDLISMASKAPDLVFEVRDGHIRLINKEETVFWFTGIHARIALASDEKSIAIKCKSNLGEMVSVTGSLNLKELSSEGHIKLYKFQPEALYNYLLPTSSHRIPDSLINLDINFEANGEKYFHALFFGSIPQLSLENQKDKFPFAASNIEGELRIDDAKTNISFHNINLENPRLNLTGSFRQDDTTKMMGLQIQAKKVDIKSVREAALFLVGRYRITQKIFEIIKGGYSPRTEFSSKANSISELGKEENFIIKGQMQDGKIYIPQADLDLNQASGYAVVSNGILEGENLEASAGNSRAYNGNFKLGLGRKNDIFRLDVLINGDLSELPLYLLRYIKNKKVRNEISLINNLKGNAQARLILGDTKSSIQTKIEATEINLFANNTRIPYPIEIKGGQFLFDKKRVDLDNLNLNLGQSSFAGLSGWVDWDQATDLNIKVNESKISLNQLLPWLSSFKNMGSYIKYLDPFDGSLAFSSLKVEGPLLEPGEWDIQIKGEGNLYDGTGPRLSLDFTKRPEEFVVNNLTIDDEVSHAVLKAKKGERIFGIDFMGSLRTDTLRRIFSDRFLFRGWVKGAIRAELFLDKPLQSSAEGNLEGENLISPLSLDDAFKINKISIEANKNQFNVKLLDLSLGGTNLAIEGNASSTKDGFLLLFDASSDRIEWEDIKSALDRFKKGGNTKHHGKRWDLPVKGNFGIKSENFHYDRFNWSPFNAELKFDNNIINIIISDASLCGIDTPGAINISSSNKNLDFKLSSSNQKLRKTINCLFKKENIISGDFDFEGAVKADFKNEQLIRSLQGNLHLSARNGRIYHDKFLLEVLDIMRIVNLRLPDVGNKGLAYKSLEVNGSLKNGALVLDDSLLDSPTMAVLVDGDVDLVDKTVDLKLKVAPIKLVNFATTKIPILRRIRRGHLLSIPVRIKGDWGSPEVKKEE
jgi:AsmA-like C-terminal region